MAKSKKSFQKHLETPLTTFWWLVPLLLLGVVLLMVSGSLNKKEQNLDLRSQAAAPNNRLLNGSFENGLAQWQTSKDKQSSTIRVVTEQKSAGAKSLKIVNTVVGLSQASQEVYVDPNTSYTVSVDASGSAHFVIREGDEINGKKELREGNLANVVIDTATFTPKTATVTTHAKATAMKNNWMSFVTPAYAADPPVCGTLCYPWDGDSTEPYKGPKDNTLQARCRIAGLEESKQLQCAASTTGLNRYCWNDSVCGGGGGAPKATPRPVIKKYLRVILRKSTVGTVYFDNTKLVKTP